MSKVISMADKSGDARLWDVEQMLQNALHDVRSGNRPTKKALILFLDDESDYLVGFSQCGMTTGESILLCELGKDRLKQEIYD
jgi:hypothetical protein